MPAKWGDISSGDDYLNVTSTGFFAAADPEFITAELDTPSDDENVGHTIGDASSDEASQPPVADVEEPDDLTKTYRDLFGEDDGDYDEKPITVTHNVATKINSDDELEVSDFDEDDLEVEINVNDQVSPPSRRTLVVQSPPRDFKNVMRLDSSGNMISAKPKRIEHRKFQVKIAPLEQQFYDTTFKNLVRLPLTDFDMQTLETTVRLSLLEQIYPALSEASRDRYTRYGYLDVNNTKNFNVYVKKEFRKWLETENSPLAQRALSELDHTSVLRKLEAMYIAPDNAFSDLTRFSQQQFHSPNFIFTLSLSAIINALESYGNESKVAYAKRLSKYITSDTKLTDVQRAYVLAKEWVRPAPPSREEMDDQYEKLLRMEYYKRLDEIIATQPNEDLFTQFKDEYLPELKAAYSSARFSIMPQTLDGLELDHAGVLLRNDILTFIARVKATNPSTVGNFLVPFAWILTHLQVSSYAATKLLNGDIGISMFERNDLFPELKALSAGKKSVLDQRLQAQTNANVALLLERYMRTQYPSLQANFQLQDKPWLDTQLSLKSTLCPASTTQNFIVVEQDGKLVCVDGQTLLNTLADEPVDAIGTQYTPALRKWAERVYKIPAPKKSIPQVLQVLQTPQTPSVRKYNRERHIQQLRQRQVGVPAASQSVFPSVLPSALRRNGEAMLVKKFNDILVAQPSQKPFFLQFEKDLNDKSVADAEGVAERKAAKIRQQHINAVQQVKTMQMM